MSNHKDRRFKKFSRAFLLLFCWVVVPLVIVEVAMIFLEPYLFKGFYQYDPDIGFRVRSNAPEANQFGFNDREYPLQKAPGTFRILIVGDSFNWAGGRDGNYTALLGKKLNSIPDKPQVEVINGGYPMTHTGEQLIILRKYGLQYNPNLVVLGFFAGNDFVDADPYRKRIVVNDTYIDIDKRREMKVFGYPLVLRSRLLLFVEQKYKIFRGMLKTKAAAAKETQQQGTVQPAPQQGTVQQPQRQGTFSEEVFLSIEASRMDFCNLNTFRQGKYRANIEYIFKSITEMARLLKARNISFVVAIFPDEFQVNERLAQDVFTKLKLNRNDYQLDLTQRVLKEFLKSQDIPYIDMLPRFKQVSEEKSLYIFRDTHWNEAGNQLAADILYEYLSDTAQAAKSSIN